MIRAPHRWFIPLLLLLAWGMALRVWLATPDLTAGRFWDERYQIENLRALLKDGQLHPVKGFYPGLSYLPQAVPLAGAEMLYRLTGRRSFAVFDEAGGMTPTGYFLCRFLQALAGTLSLYLTFRIGRRLFSPGVGLLAALLLAGVPWHLRQSVIFKPDILLAATCLLAFELSLRAAEQPGLRRFVQAGGAIGLALATKLTAGPIAIPLMVAALTGGGWREGRSWGRLVAAGVASVAVFLLLTPFFVLDLDFYVQQNGNTLKSYAHNGMVRGSSSLSTLWAGLEWPLSAGYHGPWLGSLALLGLGIWIVRALRPGRPEIPRMQRLGPAMAAAFVLSFVLLYSVVVSFPKAHNWLPLAPFTALAAAWVLFGIWQELSARLSFLRRGPAEVAVAGSLSVLVGLPVTLHTYRNVVPTTHEQARRILQERIDPQPGRAFVFEHGDAPPLVRAGRSGLFLQSVERLDSLALPVLDRADAELFLASRLEGEERAFYQSRVAAADPAAALRLAPRLFRARGPELLLVLHPWRLVEEPTQLRRLPGEDRTRWVGRLPDVVPPGATGSLDVALLPGWKREMLRQILVDGHPVAWHAVGKDGRRPRYFSQRFPVAGSGVPVTLELGRGLPPERPVKVIFRCWARRGTFQGPPSSKKP